MATIVPVADVHSAFSATTTVKAPKAKATNKEKKAVDHPAYLEMVMASISALAERKGSSRAAIFNYVLQNYNVGADNKKVNLHLSKNLKKGADSGLFERLSGVGAIGRFRLGEAAKAATKKAAKKTSVKSPKKAVIAKSPKKAVTAKSPKKTVTAKSPKKTVAAMSSKKAATAKLLKKATDAKSSKKVVGKENAVGKKKTAKTKKTTATTAKSDSAKRSKAKSPKKVTTKSTKTTKALKTRIVA